MIVILVEPANQTGHSLLRYTKSKQEGSRKLCIVFDALQLDITTDSRDKLSLHFHCCKNCGKISAMHRYLWFSSVFLFDD